MKYKLIALDVDGTLLDDNHMLSEQNRETIAEVSRRGGQIVLCTGRGLRSAAPLMEELGLGGYLIGHNGAATMRMADGEVVHQYGMDARGLDPYIDYCREHGIHFDVNTAFNMYVDNVKHLTDEAHHMYEHFKMIPAALPAWEEFRDPIVKFTIFSAEIETLEKTLSEWMTWTQPFNLLRSGDFFADMMHKEASKGSALQQLAQRLGVEREEVLSIGNYFNDVSMLVYAGMGIAMENSPVEVKAAADALTGTNNENGVHQALVKYCLA